MRWSVPRCFDGGTVAILASGPSMSQAVADQVHAAGVPAVAINLTHRLAPWAWMLYAADIEWWQHPTNADAWRFAGLKVTVNVGRHVPPGLLTLENSGGNGFDPDPRALRTGNNSGYQAVHIATHAGARRILLCGMDMGGCHWHGPHPADLKVTAPATYERWRQRFAELAPLLAARGVDVVNCTPGSRLDCFRRGNLETELASCPEPASAGAALPA